MAQLIRSALFKRQLLSITAGYRWRAGAATALRFIEQLESALRFVAAKPLACAIYTRIAGKDFRKWRLAGFPVSVFFRLQGEDVIVLEALYAHRMNIDDRFAVELGEDE